MTDHAPFGDGFLSKLGLAVVIVILFAEFEFFTSLITEIEKAAKLLK